jgi:hypothetical protein
MDHQERGLRRRLGIPEDAAKVLIFGESSHWDPNWLLTSEGYYNLRIERILDAAIAALEAEPRRVFSIECLFFLRLYWDRRPDRRQQLRQLITSGRLRLTGTGITTPDTVLPSTEAILRDFLLGYRWLQDNGLYQEPRMAYFPDSFGHSPLLPAILRSLGLSRAAVTRIDGMYFMGSDYRSADDFPLPGSTAQLLLQQHGSVDFVWQAPDGSEVLSHWNAFTYFQGDMLAHLGIIRWMGLSFGLPWRTERHVARRIEGFVDQLQPISRTPYLFCPMGCDFNGPVDGLWQLLDRYNRTRYQETGVWAINAGLDDYLDLVECHQPDLPVLQVDPNPYWMGFYASRPALKRRCNSLASKLGEAETLAIDLEGGNGFDAQMARAWDLVALSNHHDFITGTAPERVWRSEQHPWLQEAEGLADSLLARVRPDVAVAASADPPPTWSLQGGRLELTTDHYSLVLDEAAGGCITSLVTATGELIAAPANDLVAYRDSGGLWRMGHEFRGGVFKEQTRASAAPAQISAREEGDTLRVTVRSELAEQAFERRLWFKRACPVIRGRIVGAAAHRLTITCAMPLAFAPHELVMDVPGGVVTRPTQKIYDPTFWPARTFVHARDPVEGHGLAAILSGPACVTVGSAGLEWVVLRNAPLERAFGVLPIPAHPASGADPDVHDFDYALLVTAAGDFKDNRLPWLARHELRTVWTGGGEVPQAADDLVQLDRDDVLLSAVKRAADGRGIVVRLIRYAPETSEVELTLSRGELRAATRCDAAERDLAALEVKRGRVRVPLEGTINSVRLEPS